MKKVNKNNLTTPQFGIVAYAVFLLGGHEHAIDTEDIAIRVHELAPGRFSWRKYPDQINLELIRTALSDAKKSKNGSLVTGVGKKGWTLTPAGLHWVKKHSSDLSLGSFSRNREESKAGSIDENRWRRERSRILTTRAWNKWTIGDKESIDQKEANEVFRIDSYSTGSLRSLKISRVCSKFEDDPEIGSFIRYIAVLLDRSS